MSQIVSKVNGNIIDALPHADVVVKMGKGKFAQSLQRSQPRQDSTAKVKKNVVRSGKKSTDHDDNGVVEVL